MMHPNPFMMMMMMNMYATFNIHSLNDNEMKAHSKFRISKLIRIIFFFYSQISLEMWNAPTVLRSMQFDEFVLQINLLKLNLCEIKKTQILSISLRKTCN